jgi:hypothetical protein
MNFVSKYFLLFAVVIPCMLFSSFFSATAASWFEKQIAAAKAATEKAAATTKAYLEFSAAYTNTKKLLNENQTKLSPEQYTTFNTRLSAIPDPIKTMNKTLNEYNNYKAILTTLKSDIQRAVDAANAVAKAAAELAAAKTAFETAYKEIQTLLDNNKTILSTDQYNNFNSQLGTPTPATGTTTGQYKALTTTLNTLKTDIQKAIDIAKLTAAKTAFETAYNETKTLLDNNKRLLQTDQYNNFNSQLGTPTPAIGTTTDQYNTLTAALNTLKTNIQASIDAAKAAISEARSTFNTTYNETKSLLINNSSLLTAAQYSEFENRLKIPTPTTSATLEQYNTLTATLTTLKSDIQKAIDIAKLTAAKTAFETAYNETKTLLDGIQSTLPEIYNDNITALNYYSNKTYDTLIAYTSATSKLNSLKRTITIAIAAAATGTTSTPTTQPTTTKTATKPTLTQPTDTTSPTGTTSIDTTNTKDEPVTVDQQTTTTVTPLATPTMTVQEEPAVAN